MSRNKHITITEAQLKKERNIATDKAVILFIAAAMDEFGWTEAEIDRFAERLNRYAKAVEDKVISLDKVSHIIKDEIGVEIKIN